MAQYKKKKNGTVLKKKGKWKKNMFSLPLNAKNICLLAHQRQLLSWLLKDPFIDLFMCVDIHTDLQA